ncbi:VWA domain-containing protein [Halothiobacillus diazotrophicus]|uniref:VWA domain-containing protein n=1 Tax=Halothiobacillus diazotrophicus TaxID=1860122 RepID=A0A191ZGS3_9GAMM|nr:VWA domain-containing protein [Halothiobacillus diazotrophicus]ANJ67052.1 VWA domain-containing protein [Halothiobacillus diazotrophicus]
MSISMDQHQALFDDLGEPVAEVLKQHWHDLTRLLSPLGFQTFLESTANLNALGRGDELVIAFIESSVPVAREIGETSVFELLSSVIQMFSKASGSVLARVFQSAPVAVSRLGEAELFNAYLSLLDHVAAKAPRALRPLLDHIEELLGSLTLGGLRRWITWGIQAHRNDFAAQDAYFSLSTPESRAVLQRERRGVLFVDVQRRLVMYLRALWGRDFFLRPTSGDFETRTGYRPFIDELFINLPDAYDDYKVEGHEPVDGLSLYRAAAAHAAAHQIYSRIDPKAKDTGPLERVLVGLIEDARVERLAMADFPGLVPLWLNFHRLTLAALPDEDRLGSSPRMSALFDRIALALCDDAYLDDHPLVQAARHGFAALGEDMQSQEAARTLGLTLAEQVRAQNLPFQSRTDIPSSPYRDDNAYLWIEPDAKPNTAVAASIHDKRKYVSVMEMLHALDVEFATAESADEIWVLATELYDDDGTTFNELYGTPPMASPRYYPEWDYQTQLERPLWTTLTEKKPALGDPETIEEILAEHAPMVRRLKYLIEALQPQGVVRQKKIEDGDEVDLNAAIQAMTDIRMNRQPDPRIGIRRRIQVRDLSVILLIDLSESTNDPVRTGDGEKTVLDLAREAAALLGDALDRIGDPYAIHGFDSNGRSDVEYFRFKDFDDTFNDLAKARLAGMTGQLSTRMGTALRHAGRLLDARASQRKLILLLTDGEPSDNDVRDPQYLRHDTKRVVEELRRRGIETFCVTLDPHADEYVERIFGAKHYMVLDQVARLPEKLPALYLSMTRT